MKHLKKLAALLLVGVLALSLLTACGGGGGSTSADAQAEAAVMAAINQNRPANDNCKTAASSAKRLNGTWMLLSSWGISVLLLDTYPILI